MDENNLKEFQRLRNKVRQATRQNQKYYEKKTADEAKSNPKKFWQYINM